MKFKVGDIVICKPGFTTEGHSSSDIHYVNHGGSGYVNGRIFEIRDIDNYKYEQVLWPWDGGDGGGVYSGAVELYKENKENYQIY
jgi:hypothetical protein